MRAKQPQPEPVEDVELSPEEWAAWQIFLDTLRDWNLVAGIGGVWFEGVKVPAIESAMNLRRIKPRERLKVWSMVKVLEDEARLVRNKVK